MSQFVMDARDVSWDTGIRTSWHVVLEITAHGAEANSHHAVLTTLAVGNTTGRRMANTTCDLEDYFENQSLDIDCDSVDMQEPEIIVVTATMTTVSVTETSVTFSSTGSSTSITSTSATSFTRSSTSPTSTSEATLSITESSITKTATSSTTANSASTTSSTSGSAPTPAPMPTVTDASSSSATTATASATTFTSTSASLTARTASAVATMTDSSQTNTETTTTAVVISTSSTPAPAPQTLSDVVSFQATVVQQLLDVFGSNTSEVGVQIVSTSDGITTVGMLIAAPNASDTKPAAVLSVPNSSAQVTIPVSVFAHLGEQLVVAVISTFGSAGVTELTDSSGSFVDEVVAAVSVNLASASSASFIDVSDLPEPILVTLPEPSTSNMSCIWWDEDAQSWSTSGLESVDNGQNVLVCASEHLTMFAAAILTGIVNTIECSQVWLLSQEGYAELLRLEWVREEGMWVLYTLLAAITVLAGAAVALDCSHSGGRAWATASFIIVAEGGASARSLNQVSCGGGIIDAIREACDDVMSGFFEFFGDVRSMCELIHENVKEAITTKDGLELLALGVLARSSLHQASCALRMHADDVAFLTEEATTAEMYDDDGDEDEDEEGGSADPAEGPQSEEPPVEPVEPPAAGTAALLGAAAATEARRPGRHLRREHTHGAPPPSASGGDADAVGVAGRALTRKKTLAALASVQPEHQERFERLSDMRGRLAQKHEEKAAFHAQWKHFPQMMCRSFLLQGPIGSVFTGSVITSRRMRALLLACEVLGGLMLATLFFVSSEGPRGKKSPKQCDSTCEGNVQCEWQMLGRYLVIGIASALIAGVPVTFLHSLHYRRIRHVENQDDALRIMRRWRRKDLVIWIVGSAYCLFAVNYLVLFFANVSTTSHVKWLTIISIAIAEDFVVGPLIIAVVLPLLAFSLLSCFAIRKKSKKHELVKQHHASTVAHWHDPSGGGDMRRAATLRNAPSGLSREAPPRSRSSREPEATMRSVPSVHTRDATSPGEGRDGRGADRSPSGDGRGADGRATDAQSAGSAGNVDSGRIEGSERRSGSPHPDGAPSDVNITVTPDTVAVTRRVSFGPPPLAQRPRQQASTRSVYHI